MISTNVRWDITPEQLKDMTNKAMEEAMHDAVEVVLQEANKKVPLDEGTLQRSGNVDVDTSGSEVKGSVYYDTPYAKRLHENPQYNFQRGREGKWLENTVKEHQDVLTKCMKNRLGERLGG